MLPSALESRKTVVLEELSLTFKVKEGIEHSSRCLFEASPFHWPSSPSVLGGVIESSYSIQHTYTQRVV